MKNFRLLFGAFLLTITLTVSALAGEMPTMGIPAPAPPSADSNMPESGVEAPATEVMLTVVESILSIL